MQGVGVSGIGYVLMTSCIEKRWHMPLIQIIAAVLDLLILLEQLYLGRYWLLLKICENNYTTRV